MAVMLPKPQYMLKRSRAIILIRYSVRVSYNTYFACTLTLYGLMPPLDIWNPGNSLSPLWHQAVAWMDEYILDKSHQNILKPYQSRINTMTPYFLSPICLIIIIQLEHLKQSCRYMSEYSPYCLCINSMWSDDIWNPGNGLSTLWH